MKLDETKLKQRLKEARDTVFLLYGEEPYLTHHYRRRIVADAVAESGMEDLNLHELDGRDVDFATVQNLAETLPMLAEYSCVSVRDWDFSRSADTEHLIEWLADPPPHCVLVFWMSGAADDSKKSAKWKNFVVAVDKVGVVTEFPRKEPAEIVRLLVSGATRRGCVMQPAAARQLVEQCGDDLYMLLGELDKLCAVAGNGGEVTTEMVVVVGTKRLEASVFELSRAILKNHYERTYDILHRLRTCREEPIAILGVLSGAYADLYRAKVAAASGVPATALVKDFDYRGKDFRLKNAARDAAGMSIAVIRQCLDLLAQTDMQMKSTSLDKWELLEQTAAEMILLVRQGG